MRGARGAVVRRKEGALCRFIAFDCGEPWLAARGQSRLSGSGARNSLTVKVCVERAEWRDVTRGPSDGLDIQNQLTCGAGMNPSALRCR